MKLFVFSVLALFVTSVHAADKVDTKKIDKDCRAKALKIVKAVTESMGESGVTGYGVEESKAGDKDHAVTVRVGTGGEDSDQYLDYEVKFRTGVISKACYAVESIVLTGEN